MNITLYRNHSDNKTMDKNISDPSVAYDVEIFQPLDVLNPILKINAFKKTIEGTYPVEDYNYVYIPMFERYYYCKVTLEKHMAILTCTVDPLMSHKASIKKISTMVSRNEFTYNAYLPDERLPINPRKFITSKQIYTPHGNLSSYLLLVKG